MKAKLKTQYAKLNPAKLKRNITELQNRLTKQTVLKEKLRKEKQEKILKIRKISSTFFDDSTYFVSSTFLNEAIRILQIVPKAGL